MKTFSLSIVCTMFVCIKELTSMNVCYMKSDTNRSAKDFIIQTSTSSTIGKCILLCEKEKNTLAIAYGESTGFCVCHSVLPQSLSKMFTTDNNIFFRADQTDNIAVVCQVATLKGYLFNSSADFCYKVHTEGRTWIQADLVCKDEGGLLAKVDTVEKRQLVNSIVEADGSSDYYLGATDAAEDGVWRWIADNTTIPGFNMTGYKQCLEIDNDDQTFDNSACSLSYQRFICEILMP